MAKTLKGECKGYAHIEFSCEKDMRRALMEMNGYKLNGKKMKIEIEEELLCELKNHEMIKRKSWNAKDEKNNNQPQNDDNKPHDNKQSDDDKQDDSNDNSSSSSSEYSPGIEDFEKRREFIHSHLGELSKKLNKMIFTKCPENSVTEIPVSLSTNNPQLVCELKHLFTKDMSEMEFKQQVERNDELKKIYENCCSVERLTIEQKLCKIKHCKFDDHPTRDEHLKTLCSVLVKAFEDSDIDFNVCSALKSNMKTINCLPENDAVVFELTFDNEILGEQSFKEFIMDKRRQKVLEMTLQKKMSDVLDVPFGEIVFLKIRQGSVKFDGIIPFQVLSRHTEGEIDIQEFVYKNLKEKITEGLGAIYPLKNVEVALQTIKNKLNLNPADFDSRGDYYFKSKKGDKIERGGLAYYQPSKKWRRFGIRVLEVYENDDWIKMDGNPNEWAIAFHGTRNSGEKGLESILKTRFVGRGSSNSYAGLSSKNKQEPIPKTGIYFAQNVEDCYKMPIELDGEKYEVAFQCRVHPDHVWVTGNRSYIVVDNPNYVRPYGIVLKKLSK